MLNHLDYARVHKNILEKSNKKELQEDSRYNEEHCIWCNRTRLRIYRTERKRPMCIAICFQGDIPFIFTRLPKFPPLSVHMWTAQQSPSILWY